MNDAFPWKVAVVVNTIAMTAATFIVAALLVHAHFVDADRKRCTSLVSARGVFAPSGLSDVFNMPPCRGLSDEDLANVYSSVFFHEMAQRPSAW